MTLSQALLAAKKELYPEIDYHLLRDDENVEVNKRARDILKERIT